MTIREYSDATDQAAVIALWNRVFGPRTGRNDPLFSIQQKLRVRDGLFFVAVDRQIIGTAMAGYDGHRGWIYSVAVTPEARRRGVGAALIRHAEHALAARGCVKVNLQILESNAAVAGFYEQLGYAVEPRISMGKLLPTRAKCPRDETTAMPSFTVRQLTAEDVPIMRGMLEMFGRAFRDVKTYTEAPPTSTYLERLLAGPSFLALAALTEGVVIGGLAAYVLEKFEQARSEIYIYDLAVDDAYRRQHVATTLIGELRRLAADRGAYVIYVQADLEDAPAIALYSKMGAREDVLHFDIPADPPR